MNESDSVKRLTNVKGEQIALKDRYLSVKEVAGLCGLSRTTIQRLVDKNQFPPSHAITESRKVWFESDIQEWRTLGAQAFYEMYGKQLEQQAA